MKKSIILLLLAVFILTIHSCVAPQQTMQIYNPYAPFRYNFVTKKMIRDGEKLKEEYPDEDFIYDNQHITYTFNVDEDLLGQEEDNSKSKKSPRKKRKSKTIYRNTNQVITVTENNLESTLEKFLNDLETADWQKSGVSVVEKTKFDVTALDDRLNFEHAVFYTPAETVSSLKGMYAYKDNTSFMMPTYTKQYESNGIFHDDVKVAFTRVPMYVIGNTLSVEYTRTYVDYKYLNTIYFPDDYRIKEKTVTIEIPEGLEVEIVEKNLEGYEVKRTEGEAPITKKEAAEDDDDDDDDNDRRSKRKRKTRKKRSRKTEPKPKNLKTINYTIKDVRAMGNEYANYGYTHSVPHLLLLCKSYYNGKDTVKLLSDATDLYKWYSTLANKMENETEEVATLAKKITEGKKTDEEKISAIFYWVQDNIRYLAFEDGVAAFKPDECQNVYSKRYGDCKGMANLTKEMLKSLGYDARLTWIGTSRIAYEGTTPSLSSANHMICAVYLDSTQKPYFLDATEKYVAFGDYADRIQGRKVIIENGDNYIVETVPVYPPEHNKIQKTESYNIVGDKLKGEVKKVYNGESKTTILSSYNNVKIDARERALRTFLNQNNYNLIVSDIKHTDFSERTKPFEINYNLEVKNQVLKDGNKLYINLDWEKDWENYNIDTARYSHHSFSYKKHLSKETKLTIPDGYKVESLPQAVNYSTDDFVFKLSVTQSGKTIIYKKEIIMPKGYLHINNIKEWNEANKKVSDFYDKYIILTK